MPRKNPLPTNSEGKDEPQQSCKRSRRESPRLSPSNKSGVSANNGHTDASEVKGKTRKYSRETDRFAKNLDISIGDDAKEDVFGSKNKEVYTSKDYRKYQEEKWILLRDVGTSMLPYADQEGKEKTISTDGRPEEKFHPDETASSPSLKNSAIKVSKHSPCSSPVSPRRRSASISLKDSKDETASSPSPKISAIKVSKHSPCSSPVTPRTRSASISLKDSKDETASSPSPKNSAIKVSKHSPCSSPVSPRSSASISLKDSKDETTSSPSPKNSAIKVSKHSPCSSPVTPRTRSASISLKDSKDETASSPSPKNSAIKVSKHSPCSSPVTPRTRSASICLKDSKDETTSMKCRTAILTDILPAKPKRVLTYAEVTANKVIDSSPTRVESEHLSPSGESSNDGEKSDNAESSSPLTPQMPPSTPSSGPASSRSRYSIRRTTRKNYSEKMVRSQRSSTNVGALDQAQASGDKASNNSTPESNEESDDLLYEVEDVVNVDEEDGRIIVFVKWKGWPSSTNTWEPLENIYCLYPVFKYLESSETAWRKYGMEIFGHFMTDLLDHTDEKLNLGLIDCLLSKTLDPNMYATMSSEKKLLLKDRIRKLTPRSMITRIQKKYKNVQEFVRLMTEWKDCQEDLQEWLKKSTAGLPEELRKMVSIENLVDSAVPNEYEFIPDYDYTPGIVPKWAEVGCQCDDCFTDSCDMLHNSEPMYSKEGGLLISTYTKGFGVFECNKACKCPLSCFNRLSQNSPRIPVTIYRLTKYPGWALRTDVPIEPLQFTGEYLGEVIDKEAAKERHPTYLFDLDFNLSKCGRYTIDAEYKGNATGFINHACFPNLRVIPIWVDNTDIEMPRLAFFTSRLIQAHEELTFSYVAHTLDNEGRAKRMTKLGFKCKCGHSRCINRSKKSSKSYDYHKERLEAARHLI